MTDRDEADRPVRNLHAYFYDFDPTGCDPVDAILEAVARAGKQYHHTQDWGDEDGSEDSCIAHIQDAAEIAATVLREAEQRGMLRAAEIARKLVDNEVVEAADLIIDSIEDAANDT